MASPDMLNSHSNVNQTFQPSLKGKFIPVPFEKQIIPGTFEYSLNRLVDHELDFTIFDERYRNEETGATGLRSKNIAEDHPVCLCPGNHLQQAHRTGVRGEHHLHGLKLRCEASFYNDRRLRFDHGQGDAARFICLFSKLPS